MNIHLDLNSPTELRAFAAFCTALADGASAIALEAANDRKVRYQFDNGMMTASAVAAANQEFGTTTQPGVSGSITPETTTTQLFGSATGTTETAVATTRERGKPSAGKARRTNAEIAEDEAADKADAAAAASGTMAISTGNERVDPAQQDKIDEAKEVADTKVAGAAATSDDLRVAMMAYAEKFGMDEAFADGPAIFQSVLGLVPEGTTNGKGEPVDEWTLTAVKEPRQISAALDAWAKATARATRYGA